MISIQRQYPRRPNAPTVKQLLRLGERVFDPEHTGRSQLWATVRNTSTSHPTDHDQLLDLLGHGYDAFDCHIDYPQGRVEIHFIERLRLKVTGPTPDRVHQYFDRITPLVDRAQPYHPRFDAVRVIIGHGRSAMWEDVTGFLETQQGLEVVHYETGGDNGLAVRRVLADASHDDSVAFLVRTAEDERLEADGANQSVIHEAGLFQGKFGFDRVRIIRESGSCRFDDIDGVDIVRFEPDRIDTVLDQLLLVIHREFPGRLD